MVAVAITAATPVTTMRVVVEIVMVYYGSTTR